MPGRSPRHDVAAPKQEIANVRTELKTDIGRLGDRIYGLAAGMRPPWEQKRAD